MLNTKNAGEIVINPEVVNDCVAFHRQPISKAWLRALYLFSQKKEKRLKILELGASGQSAIAPIFGFNNHQITVSCYRKDELADVESFVGNLCKKYKIDQTKFHFQQMDCFEITGGQYDLIITNRMIGGLSRTHDLDVFKKSIKAIKEHLTHTGWAFVVDKAKPIFPLSYLLQKFGTAGKNQWHYFSSADLQKVFEDQDLAVPIERFGFVSVGNFNGNPIERGLDKIDNLFEKYFKGRFGPIYLAIIQKTAE